jgi:P2 family phage contractile tail tube protein
MTQKIGGQTGTFMLYLDGKDLLGVAEVKLPEIKYKTTTIGGSGILGDIEFINPYSIESLETEIKFNTITNNTFDLLSMSGKLIEMKAAVIEADGTTHAIGVDGLRANMRGNAKGIDLGTIKKDDLLNTSFKMENTFVEVFKGGNQLYKVDKLNGILEAAGKALIKKLSDLF